MTSDPRPVLLDCDPGHDDAVALLLAAGDPRLELLGITTVAGNQTLDRTTRNALAVCTIGGIDVPIAAGCEAPLLRPLRTAGDVHGPTGLDGPAPIEPGVRPVDAHAVDLLREVAHARPGEVTLVAVGPLTNLALAVRVDPSLATAVREVVLMGGSWAAGNTTQTAEFNMLVDPEAAAIVFSAPWRVTMMGLQLTHQARCTPAVQRRIRAVGSPAATFVADLMEYYGDRYRKRLGVDGGPPVHDPCAVAHVADPTLIAVAPAAIGVETAGLATAGTTLVERRDDGRHRVGTELDAGRFWDAAVAALGALPGAGGERD